MEHRPAHCLVRTHQRSSRRTVRNSRRNDCWRDTSARAVSRANQVCGRSIGATHRDSGILRPNHVLQLPSPGSRATPQSNLLGTHSVHKRQARILRPARAHACLFNIGCNPP